MKSDKRMIQSVKRATDIMDLFIDGTKQLGITDFSNMLGLPKATVAGIVNTLLTVGYLEKDPFSAKYRLGPQLFHLGMKCTMNADLITIGRSWLERLCFQFSQPVNMGMLKGGKAMLVTRIEPENSYMVFPQGVDIPIHTSCIGKVIMAYMEPAERDLVLAGYRFIQLTPNSITGRDLFLEELEEVRSSGIAFDNEENVPGLKGIGGPIFNHAGKVSAAFAVSGSMEIIEKNRKDIIEAVRYTSRQIAAQLIKMV